MTVLRLNANRQLGKKRARLLPLAASLLTLARSFLDTTKQKADLTIFGACKPANEKAIMAIPASDYPPTAYCLLNLLPDTQTLSGERLFFSLSDWKDDFLAITTEIIGDLKTP